MDNKQDSSNFFKKFLLAFLATLLIIEEWLWEILTWLGRYTSHILKLERFENWLKNAPRYVALIAFLIPVLIVTPLNIWALSCFANGRIIRGLVIELFAKLFATLLFARVFALTKTHLLSFKWFAVVYLKITSWLNWAHALIHKTKIYQLSQAFKSRVKLVLSRFRF